MISGKFLASCVLPCAGMLPDPSPIGVVEVQAPYGVQLERCIPVFMVALVVDHQMNRICSLRSAAPDNELETHVRSPAVAGNGQGIDLAADALVLPLDAGQHGRGIGQQGMENRNLGAGGAVEADRPHARNAARRRRSTVSGPTRRSVWRIRSFGIAALAARQAGANRSSQSPTSL